MAPVYKEISLDWKGKTYQLKPTFGLIQHLEQRLSLGAIWDRMKTGNPPLSLLGELVAKTLRAAGCTDEEATAENIFLELSEGHDALSQAALDIILACHPQRKLPGNAPAPSKGASQSPTSNGGSSTKLPSDTLGSNHRSSGQ